MLVVQLVRNNESEFEFAIMSQLVNFELDRCSYCRRIYEDTGHYPQHCSHCRTIRDEVWHYRLFQRARILANSGLFLQEDLT